MISIPNSPLNNNICKDICGNPVMDFKMHHIIDLMNKLGCGRPTFTHKDLDEIITYHQDLILFLEEREFLGLTT